MASDETARRPIDDEARLVARAIQRDADAFGQLYEACLDRIYRYVYYRVNSATEAEDLTEQVFLKAWEAIDRYEQRGVPFLAWLYRLAHNLVVDHYRGQRQTVPLDDLRETEELSQDIEASVHAQLDAEEVREALRHLSPEHQQLITLRFVEGMSHAEAAQIVGKSEGATRVVQYRALQALARALDCQENPRNAKRGAIDQLPG
ncbi:MAG TPA: sigma-70 family RNA polymerase sigma factor [Chloroflexota bacterium]|nr:sigma-70 family RNA polymerase sigma factor [Chloroflexota bacterium]